MRENPSFRLASAIKEAALMPAIHREIWEQYPGGLPSDPSIKHFLRNDREFTEAAATDLIQEFRKTISFAGLVPGATLSQDVEDNPDSHGRPPMTGPTTAPARQTSQDLKDELLFGSSAMTHGAVRSVPLPLSADEWVTLQGVFPITESSWSQMIAVLNAMKPGLVAQATPPRGADEPD